MTRYRQITLQAPVMTIPSSITSLGKSSSGGASVSPISPVTTRKASWSGRNGIHCGEGSWPGTSLHILQAQIGTGTVHDGRRHLSHAVFLRPVDVDALHHPSHEARNLLEAVLGF